MKKIGIELNVLWDEEEVFLLNMSLLWPAK